MCADQFRKVRPYLVLQLATIASINALELQQDKPSVLKTSKSLKKSFTGTPNRTPTGRTLERRANQIFQKNNFFGETLFMVKLLH